MKQAKKMVRDKLYWVRWRLRKIYEGSGGGESEENETGRISGTRKEAESSGKGGNKEWTE